MDKQRVQRENSQPQTDIHYDNVIWQHENYSKVATARTSVIFDPPDGRIPPLNASGQARAAVEKEAARRRDLAENAESRNLGERCISWGNEGPPMLGSTYNANMQIVETPDVYSDRNLHVVERFTRTDPDTIVYRFTVDDPTIWTKPWSGELMMRKIEGPIFEYACTEGNYGLANILAAARAKEKSER
jgi:hypothetical protein